MHIMLSEEALPLGCSYPALGLTTADHSADGGSNKIDTKFKPISLIIKRKKKSANAIVVNTTYKKKDSPGKGKCHPQTSDATNTCTMHDKKPRN